MTADPVAVARLVTDLFERLGIAYSIGGSFASSLSGEPRSTLDVDIVVALTGAHVSPLVEALASDFYVDSSAVVRAVESSATVNIIHRPTSIKLDLFVAGGTPLDASLIARRQRVSIGDPPASFYVHSPEDVLLQKLRWYRRRGETSDRQWQDVRGIVRVQGPRLDRAYLDHGAQLLGVQDLLERVLTERLA